MEQTHIILFATFWFCLITSGYCGDTKHTEHTECMEYAQFAATGEDKKC